jgi:putative NADPH-quinone reductase
LEAWHDGKPVDAKALEYKAAVAEADILVFAFPVWWGGVPAVLKGFFDKVFLPGFVYEERAGGLKGLLTDKKAIVINTMEMPSEVFNSLYQNPVKGALIKETLETCGIELLAHWQIDKISSGGRVHAEAKIKEIREFIERQ